MLLESYAQRSEFYCVHPGYKLGLFGVLVGLAYGSGSLCYELLLWGLVNGVSVRWNALRWRVHARVLGVGMLAILFSVLPMVLLTGGEWGAKWLWAAGVFLRSAVLFSGLLCLVLCTTVGQLLEVMGWLRMPGVLVELASLVYRNVFIMLGMARAVWLAQQARLGYVNWRVGVRSFASLLVSVLLLSLRRGEDQYNSLCARGYTGHWPVLPMLYKARGWWTVGVLLLSLGLFGLLWVFTKLGVL